MSTPPGIHYHCWSALDQAWCGYDGKAVDALCKGCARQAEGVSADVAAVQASWAKRWGLADG